MRPKDLKSLVKMAIESNKNLLVVGAPGIGKTEILKQVCEEQFPDATVKILHPALHDPSQYQGLFFPSPDRDCALMLPLADLKDMIDADHLMICIIDDLGQAPFSVQAALMQLVREHNVNGKKISSHVRFLLASNRKGDKAGVQGIIEPLKSRMTVVELETNVDDWIQWAIQNDMPSELIAFIKLRPNLLHDFTPTSDMSNSANPRGLAEVGEWQKSGVSKHLEYETFKGADGERVAAEYTAFLKMAREMPNPEEYLKDTAKEFPSNESTFYALCAALAYMATKKTIEKVFELAMRMDAEYSTFMVFSAIQRDKKLAATAGMARWAEKYAPYLLD